MALAVSVMLSFFAFVFFAVGTTELLYLFGGVERLPRFVRPLFAGRKGGRLQTVVSVLLNTATILLSQIIAFAALIEQCMPAGLPLLVQFAAAAAWSVHLFRAYGARN